MPRVTRRSGSLAAARVRRLADRAGRLREVRIAAVLLETTDPEALAAFYRAALGLGEPERQGPDHVGYTLSGTYLGFERVARRDDAPRPAASIWLRVEDAAAVCAAFCAAGADVEMAPDGTCSPGETLAVVRDPDGNRIGLLSDAPAPPAGRPDQASAGNSPAVDR